MKKEELEQQEEEVLVPYIPKSRAPFTLETLVPGNMAFEMKKALNNCVKKHGDIDDLVTTQLKYASKEEMWKGLAAEQVDAVGLYLMNFEKGQGIIIGDQTGIGKGRQAAAVIRHAIVNDYLPVFITRKPDLFTDMYRDLKAINFDEIKPFILNTDSNSSIKDQEGNIVFRPLKPKEQYSFMVDEKIFPTDSSESIEWHRNHNIQLPSVEENPTVTLTETKDYLSQEYNVVMATYSQIQSAHYTKRDWLRSLVENGIEGSKKRKKVVFILDESHMAGGYDSIIGTWMRQVLPKTKACCFLSATFAKYPEVMPFYGKKTAIAETKLHDGEFVYAMRSGGLALQEIVASNLAENGQLIRRQRSSEGVKVEYITLNQEPERTKNRERVNTVISLMNEIVSFEHNYILPELHGIHVEAKNDGEKVENKPRGLGVKQAPYFSKVFNVIDQLLFSLKVENVANLAIDLLRDNKKVVIAFKSTMGAFLKEMNLLSGDIIPKGEFDFARSLQKGIDSMLYYNYCDIHGEKTREKLDIDRIPGAREEYDRIVKNLIEKTTGLSLSPIDQLINLITHAKKPSTVGGHDGSHYRVGEVTGRNQRVSFQGGDAVVESFRSNTEKSFRQFNSGEIDVLLINQSGSTGSSAHASKDFKDQRQRAMLIHQFELDINTEVQKRGRIDRTGQVVKPEYYYITSDIPTELRLMNMLKSKLKALDANTTGNQKTSEKTLETPDFFNKYGDMVAWQWVDENPVMARKLGNPTYQKSWGGELERKESKEGAMRQLTGRAGLLTVEEQDELYNVLLKSYEDQINYEKQRGTYDLETEFLRLDADVKRRSLFIKGHGGTSPFGRDSVLDKTIINNLKRPLSKDAIEEKIKEELGGKTPEEKQQEFITEFEATYPKIVKERIEDRQPAIIKIQKQLDEIKKKEIESEEDGGKIRDKITQITARLHEKENKLSRMEKELQVIGDTIINEVKKWKVGQVVKIPNGYMFNDADLPYGIFLGASIKTRSKNPYTFSNIFFRFAVSDSRGIQYYNLTPPQLGELSLIKTKSEVIVEVEAEQIRNDWDEVIKKAAAKREERYILTENIVIASDKIGASNRLIKYNLQDGSIRNGILMERGYGKDENGVSTIRATLPISNALKELKGLVIDHQFFTNTAQISFTRKSSNYYQVNIYKRSNLKLITDDTLRSLIRKAEGQSVDELADFVQNAGDMTAALHIDKLESFLKRLDEFGIMYLGEPKELEEWEIEGVEVNNEEDGKQYSYKLIKDKEEQPYPEEGVISYTPPDNNHLYGSVTYSRRLSSKEKGEHGLIPLFTHVEIPYLEWKKYIEDLYSPDFHKVIEKAKTQSAYKAIETLGEYMASNPHEDNGDYSMGYVFGVYDTFELGQACYEDMIGELKPIDLVIYKLETALAA